MRGRPLEKDKEIEKRVQEILKQDRDKRGMTAKFDDDYHIVARRIQREHYWRKKLLKEKELLLRGGNELENRDKNEETSCSQD